MKRVSRIDCCLNSGTQRNVDVDSSCALFGTGDKEEFTAYFGKATWVVYLKSSSKCNHVNSRTFRNSRLKRSTEHHDSDGFFNLQWTSFCSGIWVLATSMDKLRIYWRRRSSTTCNHYNMLRIFEPLFEHPYEEDNV